MKELELVKNFIRTNVDRGDTVEDLMSSQMGGGCKGYHIAINPNIILEGKRVKRDSIVILSLEEKEVNIVFSLTEVFNLVKSKQLSLSI